MCLSSLSSARFLSGHRNRISVQRHSLDAAVHQTGHNVHDAHVTIPLMAVDLSQNLKSVHLGQRMLNHWRDDCVRWNGLTLQAIIDRDDPVITHGLASPARYVRLVRRKLNGRNRFYAQLVNEGKPCRKPKNKVGKDMIGIDPGPRVFGIAGADWGVQVDLATPLKADRKKVRRLQRHIDRQRRANNPGHYLPDGRIRPGPKKWVVSKKKPLSQRVHRCECGVGPVQRDVYSAWLARSATLLPDGETWRLDAEQAHVAWSGVESRLPAASSPISVQTFAAWARQAASGDDSIASLLSAESGTERLAGEVSAMAGEARNGVGVSPIRSIRSDVARCRESERAGRGGTGTPRL